MRTTSSETRWSQLAAGSGFTRAAFIVCAVVMPCASWPQSQEPLKKEFVVAALKSADGHSDRESISGGPGTTDPGHFIAQNATLRMLLLSSYRIRDYQIVGSPKWIDQKHYDINAQIPPGSTMADVHVMVQALLEARLHLKAHRANIPHQGYEVGIASSGLKIKNAATAVAPEVPHGKDGFIRDEWGLPDLPVGRPAMRRVVLPNGLTRLIARMLPMSVFISSMENELDGSPVLDSTGLTGKYDFTLDYARSAVTVGSELSGPDFITAIRDQMGLVVRHRLVPVDCLVIESVDPTPVEN